MQQAIALGDRSPATYGRLITLLFETGREDEAAEYLSEVRKLGVANSEQSSMLEMLVASGLGNLDQAIQAGRRRVELNAKDYATHLALGYLLLAGGKWEEAEAALRQAVALAPKQVRAHEGLFNLCINSRRPDRALEVLKTLADQAELTDVQRTFVVAQGLARISQLVEAPKRSEYVTSAIKYCREARKLDPQWGDVQVFLADLLMRDEATKARPKRCSARCCRTTSRPGARRMLANLLAAAPNRARFQEALQLLDQGGDQGSPGSADEDRSAGPQRRRAESRGRSPESGTAGARHADTCGRRSLAVGRTLPVRGRYPGGVEQYKSLVGRNPPATRHLAQFIELLVNTRDFATAEMWLKQLEQRSPDTFESVFRLRASSGTRARATPRRSNRLSKAMLSGSSSRSRTTHRDGPSWPRDLGRLYTALSLYVSALWLARLVLVRREIAAATRDLGFVAGPPRQRQRCLSTFAWRQRSGKDCAFSPRPWPRHSSRPSRGQTNSRRPSRCSRMPRNDTRLTASCCSYWLRCVTCKNASRRPRTCIGESSNSHPTTCRR